MKYSCKKCLTTFEKDVEKCPLCGGEVKQNITKEHIMGKKIKYECPYCRHSFQSDFNICPSCGRKSERCPHCGYIFDRNWRVCPGCGKKINKIIYSYKQKSSSNFTQ